MSGVFRAIGKVFRKVAKIAKKVIIPALAIGAIVLTGGAAIGALPAIGTILGSVGISGSMAAVLGGAISAGGMGAGMGLLTGGWKGMKRGFLIGAATGGVMGAAGMVSANGVLSDIGIGSQASHVQGLKAVGDMARVANIAPAASQGVAQATTKGLADVATQGIAGQASAIVPDTTGLLASATQTGATDIAALTSMGPGGLMPAATGVATGAATGVAPAVATTAAPTAAGGAGGLLSNPMTLMMAGQALSGLGQGSATKAAARDALLKDQLNYDRAAFNYGYVNEYDPQSPQGRSTPTGARAWYNYQSPALAAVQAVPRPRYEIIGGRVVLRQGA